LFDFNDNDPELTSRCQSGDLHPTGILFGQHQSTLSDLDHKILARYPDLTEGLLKFELQADYRALRVFR
jgi:hypothetical protein